MEQVSKFIEKSISSLKQKWKKKNRLHLVPTRYPFAQEPRTKILQTLQTSS